MLSLRADGRSISRHDIIEHMAHWHIRINGIPWCCRGDLDPEPSPVIRDALINVCCGCASKADALALKAALVEIGYATWDDVEVVQNACELKDARDEG
jgi:hypothetical protein